MNLRSTLAALQEVNVQSIGQFNVRLNGSQRTYSGANLDAFRKALTQLAHIPALTRYYNAAAETSLFKRVGNEIDFDSTEFAKLQGVSLAIQNLVPAMIDTLTELVGKESENTVYVRMPDSNDLRYIANTMEEFETILGQAIYHPKVNGTIQLVGWEKGSLWMEILVGTTVAAAVIAHIVKSAAIAYRRILDNKLISAQIDGVKAKAESMEDVKNGLKHLVEMLVDAEARQIYDKFYRTDGEAIENEQIERLKHSVRTLAELMNKGAEVQPGFLMPPEVKNEFPNMKNLPALVSSIKELKP